MRRCDFANITVRLFSTISDALNPYIFGGIKSVINVLDKEDLNLISYFKTHFMTYHYFPLKECVPDMGWRSIMKCAETIIDNVREGIPTIVHCIGGNNRRPLVVECAFMLRKGIN